MSVRPHGFCSSGPRDTVSLRMWNARRARSAGSCSRFGSHCQPHRRRRRIVEPRAPAPYHRRPLGCPGRCGCSLRAPHIGWITPCRYAAQSPRDATPSRPLGVGHSVKVDASMDCHWFSRWEPSKRLWPLGAFAHTRTSRPMGHRRFALVSPARAGAGAWAPGLKSRSRALVVQSRR